MNADLLRDAKCYFAGGTLITMLLGEFRESVDIDFLCSDHDGYRKLRESVFLHGLDELFPAGANVLRDVRTDRDGIRAVLSIDGMPVKFEIVRETRIDLSGTEVPNIPVPCLDRIGLFSEKLLANADRYMDKSAMNRDVIDLLAMESAWGPVPREAWDRASAAYGDSVYGALRNAKAILRDNPEYFSECLSKMGIDEAVGERLRKALILRPAENGTSPRLGD